MTVFGFNISRDTVIDATLLGTGQAVAIAKEAEVIDIPGAMYIAVTLVTGITTIIRLIRDLIRDLKSKRLAKADEAAKAEQPAQPAEPNR